MTRAKSNRFQTLSIPKKYDIGPHVASRSVISTRNQEENPESKTEKATGAGKFMFCALYSTWHPM